MAMVVSAPAHAPDLEAGAMRGTVATVARFQAKASGISSMSTSRPLALGIAKAAGLGHGLQPVGVPHGR
jgi:hypothetical protein